MRRQRSLLICVLTAVCLFASQAVQATVICTKDLNNNGTIEQDTERWQCRGSGATYSCPYGAVQCTAQTYSVSGQGSSTLTGVAGKNGISSLKGNSATGEVTLSAWTCEAGGATCVQGDVGKLKFTKGSVSGSVTTDVITKVIGNGEKLDVYGCTGTPPCANGGSLVGSVTVTGASFSGTVSANSGILSAVAYSDGYQIMFTGYSCTEGSGCVTQSIGGIVMSGTAHVCPSGGQYPCVKDTSDNLYKCSTETCFDDSMQGMIGPTGKLCVADLNGNGKVDFDTEVGQCVTVNDKDFCPIQATNCTPADSDPYCATDGVTCPAGGTWSATNKRCEAAMVAGSYDCYLTNGSYTTLGECQEKCKITAVCTTPVITASGSVSFGKQGFDTITGGTGVLSFAPGGSINVTGCTFAGTVTATSGQVINRIALQGGNLLQVYESGNLTPKGTISVSGCTVSGELYSPAAQGFDGLSGAGVTISGMWSSNQYSNGTSLSFLADASAGTGCLFGSTYPCTNGFCSEGGDCVTISKCPDGYKKSYDSTVCYAEPTGGTYTALYNATSKMCEFTPVPTCPTGFTSYDVNTCIKDVTCPVPGALDITTDLCHAAGTPNTCPTGYTWNGTICVGTTTCAVGTWDAAKKQCVSAATKTCPSGYSWNGSLCVAGVACAAGSYNASYKYCLLGAGYSCPAGYSYNSTLGMCSNPTISCGVDAGGFGGCAFMAAWNKCYCPEPYESMYDPICTGGTWNASSSSCVVAATRTCAAGSYYAPWGVCILAPTCPAGGSFVAASNWCQAAGSNSCPSGLTWNATWGVCAGNPACGTGGTFNATSGQCEGAATNACPTGYTWNATLSLCQVAPTCPAGSTFSPSLDKCTAAKIIGCPTGYTAAAGLCQAAPVCIIGTLNTTTNKCTGNYSCPHGDNYPCLLSPTTAVLQCSPNNCANIKDSTTEQSADLTSYKNNGAHDSGGCAGTIFIFNGKGGECRTPGLQTLFMSCCDEEEDSLLIIKESCSDFEYRTAVQNNRKYCHFVGEYCKQKWNIGHSIIGGILTWTVTSGLGPLVLPPLKDCVQAANTYCCFSGVLARLIHEQGRPQLKTFKDSPWGSPQKPECRGFTIPEFSMLDFSKMDLSEFFNVIVAKVQANVQQEAYAVKNKVSTFFNNTLKKN